VVPEGLRVALALDQEEVALVAGVLEAPQAVERRLGTLRQRKRSSPLGPFSRAIRNRTALSEPSSLRYRILTAGLPT
jgi:hypothetical protein